MDCIFCKIVNGDIPSYKILEDELTIAILDISQITYGHVIVLPKAHFKDIFELDEETSKALYNTCVKVSKLLKKNLGVDSINIVSNNGPKSSQEVFHHHIHVIPRYDNDKFNIQFENNMSKYSKYQFTELLNKIVK